MTAREYPLHKGARGSMTFMVVLCFITIIGIPLAIFIMVRTKSAKVVLTPTEVAAKNVFKSTRVVFADVVQHGILTVPIRGAGIAVHAARKKVGGNEAHHLAFQLRSGASRLFMVSMYEGKDEIIAEVNRILGRPPLALELGFKWPKLAA